MKRLLTRLFVAGVALLGYCGAAQADATWTYTTLASPLAVAPDVPGGGLLLTSQTVPSKETTGGPSGIVATTVVGSVSQGTDHYTNAGYKVDITINNNNNFNRNTNINGGNRINGGGNRPSQLPNGGGNRGNGTWQHNPQHRGGTPYSNRATANKYGGTSRGASASDRQTNARREQSRQQGGRQQAGTMDRGGAGGGRQQAGAGDRGGGGGNRVGDRQTSSGGAGGRNSGAFGGSSGGGSAARASSSRPHSQPIFPFRA